MTDATRTSAAVRATAPSRGSRLVPGLVSPFLAVVPWVMTVAGLGMLLEVNRAFAAGESAWSDGALTGTVLVLLAALLWAALTAWSSAGAVVAGVVTIALGILELQGMGTTSLILPPGGAAGDAMWTFRGPLVPIGMGSLLLAAGLAAAGARRTSRG